MTPVDVLSLLGSTRVIWIDDRFATASAEKLVDLLVAHAEDVVDVCPDSIREPLRKIIDNDSAGNHDLEQEVANLSGVDRTRLLRQTQRKIEDNGNEDLSDDQILSVCTHLSIAHDDRWSFEAAEAAMLGLAESCGDAAISYIIDLNDAQGATGNTRGLDLLKTLHSAKSKATAFLLTHYATKSNESEKELELRNILLQDGQQNIAPVCVIAKERLYADGDTASSQAGQNAAVAKALRIAFKRAGLRRNVHEVLVRVYSHIDLAFKSASNDLLEIPPEQLDEYVVGRAYAEGVSELHVVERALTASMSESFRRMFSANPETLENARRLRALHSVSVDVDVDITGHHKKLETFRTQEVWESAELINRGCSPLACGDVFEMDAQADAPSHRFILLVQPCDVTLRPKGNRDSEAGFLVKLDQLDGINDHVNQKRIKLPFVLQSKQWVCDLRKTTSVRLELLDLVSYRTDGRLQYSNGQVVSDWLLPGQQVSAKAVFASLAKAVKARQGATTPIAKEVKDSRCQLTLSASGAFRYIAHGTFVEARAAAGDQPEVCAGFSWNLRRVGRVRMPYASALLGNFLAVMDRNAFDLDYLQPRPPQAPDSPLCSQCS